MNKFGVSDTLGTFVWSKTLLRVNAVINFFLEIYYCINKITIFSKVLNTSFEGIQLNNFECNFESNFGWENKIHCIIHVLNLFEA